jgi:O-antigen/teichoic acid export membrane protein
VASVGIYSAAYNIGSIVCIFAVLSKSLLATLTTSEFLSAYLIVPIVALAVILFNCRSVFSDVLTLLKRTKVIGLIYGIAALLNLILNIILVPVNGILGAAISTLLTFFIFAVIVGILSFTEIPFEINVKFILKSVIASVPMAFIVWKLNSYGAVDIVIAVGIATGVYFGVLILLRGFTKDEYGFLKGMLRV